MATQRRSRVPRLLMLLLLAGSASAVSLFDLQPVSSTSLPTECMTVYITELPGCDFQIGLGPRCTGRCRNSLDRVQSNVQVACSNVQADDGTVLGAAKNGLLTQAICGNSPGNGNGNGNGNPPNGGGNTDPNPVMTVTEVPLDGPGETLVTAPNPTPVVAVNEGAAPAPTSATFTITTAIVPSIPASRATGDQNALPTEDPTNPNIPSGGGSGPFRSGSAPAHMGHAVSVACAIAAGTLFMLL